MTATVAECADLRSLTEDALAELYVTGDDDAQAAILAECARRDRADKARDKRRAVEAEWYDAAFAQYLAAEAECRGNLLSRFGEAEGITEPMSLWRGSEAWAMRRASEELQEFWAANGGRLSIARYRRELAMAARRDHDERDLANGAGTTEPEPQPKPEPEWERTGSGAVRPVTVPLGALSLPAWAAMDVTGNITVHPTRDRAVAFLVQRRVNPSGAGSSR